MAGDVISWIWLAEHVGAGSSLGVKLINHYGSARRVYEATADSVNAEEMRDFNSREISRTKKILSDKSTDEAERIAKNAEKLGVRILVPSDGDFPKSLKNLRDAPLVLYTVGRLPHFNRDLFVAVVGTRKMSEYGRNSAFSFGYGLAAGGARVVSGMALGVDSVAMTGAMEAGGVTVAVFGCGPDVVYPKEHRDLYRAILRDGCAISEYPPGTPAAGFRFPVRNRIISGLCTATAVIEASFGSGSLITARYAAYQGRTVFALPGNVGSSGAAGTNALLKNGALVATGPEDILSEYEFIYPHSVNLTAARAAMSRDDLPGLAEASVRKLSVSSRGANNYYGKGTYGGAARDDSKSGGGVDRAENKDGESVRLGDLSDDLPPGFTRVKRPDLPEEPKRIDLDMRDEVNVRVYNLMTPDVPVTADELVGGGLSVSDVLSSMSVLELAGAIEAGAGGYYLRRGSDDLSWPGSDGDDKN